MYEKNIQAVHSAMTTMADNAQLEASYEQISEKCKLPRRTVARAIKELSANGLIKKIHAKGRGITNLYFMEPTNDPK